MANTGTLSYPSPSQTPARGIPSPALLSTAGSKNAAPVRSGRRVARAIVAILGAVYIAVVGFITLTPAGQGDAVTNLSGSAVSFIGRLPLPAGITPSDVEFLLNVAMFAPLGIFLVLLFGGRGFWLAALVGIGLSVGIEWLQEFIPSRVSDPRDLLANGGGALLGAFLALPFAPLFRVRRPRQHR